MNSYYDSSDKALHIQHSVESLDSSNPRQRSAAAEALGKLRAKEATGPLIALLQNDVNTYVRSACAEALGHIGRPEAIFPLMDALVQDTCSFVRRAAAISLGQLKAKEAQGALLRALDDSNFYVRRAAINAIGKLGIPDMGRVLLNRLDIPDPRIRRTVINALRRLETREAIPQLIAMLETYILTPSQRDLPVVKAIVTTLGNLRAQKAVPVLIRVVRGYVGGRSLAATALGLIGDPAASEVLSEALADKSIKLQLAALKSLRSLGDTSVLPEVRKLINSPDPRLRHATILTLGQLHDKASAPNLLSIAQEDSSPLVRPAAMEALAKSGDASLIPALLAMVDDTNAYLRAALAQTLVSLDGNTPQVKEALEQLAQDQVAHVVLAAQSALKQWEKIPSSPTAPSNPKAENNAISWLKRLLRRT